MASSGGTSDTSTFEEHCPQLTPAVLDSHHGQQIVTGGSGRDIPGLEDFTLTDEQRAAVLDPAQVLLLDAQAGAGKTRTAVARLLYQLQQIPDDSSGLVSSGLVLVRNRTARDAAQGYLKNAADVFQSGRIDVRTWDQFMYRILRANKEKAGYEKYIDRDPSRPDSKGTLRLLSTPGIFLRQVMDQMGIDKSQHPTIEGTIRKFEAMGLAPEGRSGNPAKQTEILDYLQEQGVRNPQKRSMLKRAAEVYRRFDETIEAGGMGLEKPVLTFGKMHRNFNNLLRDPDVRGRIHRAYGAVVFDEIHQFGRDLWEAAQGITGPQTKVTLAGDKLQRLMTDLFGNEAKYVEPGYLQNYTFAHVLRGGGTFGAQRLTENLRGSRGLVEFGSNALLTSLGLPGMRQRSNQPWGEAYQRHLSATPEELRQDFAKQIMDRIVAGENPNEIATIVHTHKEGRAFKAVLDDLGDLYDRQTKLPYKVTGWTSQSTTLDEEFLQQKKQQKAWFWQPDEDEEFLQQKKQQKAWFWQPDEEAMLQPNQVPIITVDAASGGGWKHVYWIGSEEAAGPDRILKDGTRERNDSFIGGVYTAMTRARESLTFGFPQAILQNKRWVHSGLPSWYQSMGDEANRLYDRACGGRRSSEPEPEPLTGRPPCPNCGGYYVRQPYPTGLWNQWIVPTLQWIFVVCPVAGLVLWLCALVLLIVAEWLALRVVAPAEPAVRWLSHLLQGLFWQSIATVMFLGAAFLVYRRGFPGLNPYLRVCDLCGYAWDVRVRQEYHVRPDLIAQGKRRLEQLRQEEEEERRYWESVGGWYNTHGRDR